MSTSDINSLKYSPSSQISTCYILSLYDFPGWPKWFWDKTLGPILHSLPSIMSILNITIMSTLHVALEPTDNPIWGPIFQAI